MYCLLSVFIPQDQNNTIHQKPSGFYSEYYSGDRYKTEEEAIAKNDYVTVSTASTIKGQRGYHIFDHRKKRETFLPFSYQPGIYEDVIDRNGMLDMVEDILKK